MNPLRMCATVQSKASKRSNFAMGDTSKKSEPAVRRVVWGRQFLASTVVVPPDVAEHLNTDAMAVLAVIRNEAQASGKCSLPVARIAERANIGRAKTRAAIRLAERPRIDRYRGNARPKARNPKSGHYVPLLSVLFGPFRAWLRIATRTVIHGDHGSPCRRGTAARCRPSEISLLARRSGCKPACRAAAAITHSDDFRSSALLPSKPSPHP